MVRVLRGFFYAEGISNILFGLLPLAAPARFLAQFTMRATPGVAVELLRWYGILLLVLAYIELRVLLSRQDAALALVLEGLLLGDALQLIAVVLVARAAGMFGLALGVTTIFTLILASARVIWLWRYHQSKPSRWSR